MALALLRHYLEVDPDEVQEVSEEGVLVDGMRFTVQPGWQDEPAWLVFEMTCRSCGRPFHSRAIRSLSDLGYEIEYWEDGLCPRCFPGETGPKQDREGGLDAE